VVEIPREQLYFWTRAWQKNERIADEEIARGDVHRFTDVEEAIRWLHSDED
jgi:hypothetical protein